MLARFNGNVVPFADDATSTNRTVFGGTTQSDSIDDNLNADFKKGWEIVGLNDSPTREDFNAMGYTLGALTSYLYQMGIAEYNASQEYKLNALCIGTGGNIYQSLVDANIGNALNNVSKWKNINSSFVKYDNFTGTNQNLATYGYQKLPGGLIIQWGVTSSYSQGTVITTILPIAFPTNNLISVLTDNASLSNHSVIWAVNEKTTTHFTSHWTAGPSGVGSATARRAIYIAIGH